MAININPDPSMGKAFDKASEAEKAFAIHEANKIIDYLNSHKNLSKDVKDYIASGLLSGGKAPKKEEKEEEWNPFRQL